MAVCDVCKNRFEEKEAKFEFERLTWRLKYEKLEKCLCANCAVLAVERKQEGVYFDNCVRCGRRFDLAVDERESEHQMDHFHGKTLRDFWDDGPLCADCASEKLFTQGF